MTSFLSATKQGKEVGEHNRPPSQQRQGLVLSYQNSMPDDPPRPIEGSIGSRVRLVFGATAKDFLLILNEDDGDREFQTYHCSSSIPKVLARQLKNCESKGRHVKQVDFGPGGSWFVNGIKRDGTGGHCWWGDTTASLAIQEWSAGSLPLKVSFGSDASGSESYVLIQGKSDFIASGNLDSGLVERLERIRSNDTKSINFVRLFDNDGYFISDSEGTAWNGLGAACSKELREPEKVEEVAVASDGSWVVIHPIRFKPSDRGVPRDLCLRLGRFFREQSLREDKRAREIREYQGRIARVEQEAARTQREAAERERREQEAWERQDEPEKTEQRRLDLEARSSIQEEVQESNANREQEQTEERDGERMEKDASSRVAALEKVLEDRFTEELRSIQELERHLANRKQSFLKSLAILPADRRAKLTKGITQRDSVSPFNVECVICHDCPAQHAIIPCGHNCLCNGCAQTLHDNAAIEQYCPLCRGSIESTLKVFMPT